MPFHENITSAPVNPTVPHPVSVGAWRQFPSSGDPHISIPVPTMIAGDPYMAPAGSHNPSFNDIVGWSNPNYHLGSSGTQGQRRSADESD
jgi:hypothetical protein